VPVFVAALKILAPVAPSVTGHVTLFVGLTQPLPVQFAFVTPVTFIAGNVFPPDVRVVEAACTFHPAVLFPPV
jgi:hypothetical protein